MRKKDFVLVSILIFVLAFSLLTCQPKPLTTHDLEIKEQLELATPGAIIEFNDGNLAIVRRNDGKGFYEGSVLMDIVSPGLLSNPETESVYAGLVANVYPRNDPEWNKLCGRFVL